MEFDKEFDLQAAHQREFEEEAHDKFVKKYPYKVVESLDSIRVDLEAINASSEFNRDIYDRIDKFVHGGLVDELLISTRQIDATLSKIKYTLYIITFVLLCLLVK